MFAGTYLWSFIKIGSVRAEIFLIWTNVAWKNVTMTVEICSRSSQEPIFKVSSQLGQLELRYSRYGQMSRGQMSSWQLESVLDAPRNLPVKFHQNQVSKLRYPWYVQMSRGQMLCGQMSSEWSASVKDSQRNLPLKFHNNPVINSWDIPDVDRCCKDKCCLYECHHDSWNLF